jgi:hypothetical protein
MFYGGKLAAHLSNAEDASTSVSEFIRLRRLNRRGVILIDSDKSSAHSHLNETKKRLRAEFDQGPGFAWITSGREIENYLPIACVEGAVRNTHRSATRTGGSDRFDNVLKIRRSSGGEAQASKVEVAKWIVANQTPDLDPLDLRPQLSKLLNFIRESNPKL